MSAAASTGLADALFVRILRNAGLLLGGKLATGLLNLAAFGVAMHSLGAARMGLLVLVHGFAQTAATLVKFQSWQAVLRFGAGALQPAERGSLHALLRFTIGLDVASGLLGGALTAAAAWWLGPAFGWPAQIVPWAMLYATSTLFLVVATPIGLLRLFDRFDLLARRDAAGAGFRLAGALVAAGLGAGLGGFLAAWYVAAALGAGVLIGAAWRETARRGLLRASPGPRPRIGAAHPGIWGFVWSTNLMSTLSLASGQLTTLCVGWMLGPAAAALFSLARQIGEAALKPSRFLTPALYAELAQLVAAGERAALRRLLRRAVLTSAAVAAGLLAVLGGAGPLLLRLVGGHDAPAAYPVMLLLAAGASVGFAGFALEPLLVSVGRHGLALRLRAASTLGYLALALLLLRPLGLEGAGVAAVLSALGLLAGQAAAAMRWLWSDEGGSACGPGQGGSNQHDRG